MRALRANADSPCDGSSPVLATLGNRQRLPNVAVRTRRDEVPEYRSWS